MGRLHLLCSGFNNLILAAIQGVPELQTLGISAAVVVVIVEIDAAEHLRRGPGKGQRSSFRTSAIFPVGPALLRIVFKLLDPVVDGLQIIRLILGGDVLGDSSSSGHVGARGVDGFCHADRGGDGEGVVAQHRGRADDRDDSADSLELRSRDRCPSDLELPGEGTVGQDAADHGGQGGKRVFHGSRGDIPHGNHIGNDMDAAGDVKFTIGSKVQFTADGVIAGGLVVFTDGIPCNGAVYRLIICQRAGCLGQQLRLVAGHDGIVADQGIAGQAGLGLFAHLLGGHGHAAAEAAGCHVHGEAARVLGAADDDQGLAGVGVDVGRGLAGEDGALLVLGGGGLVAVVHAEDDAVQIAVIVGDIDGDIGQAGTVGVNLGLVHRDLQLRDSARCGYGGAAYGIGNQLIILVIGLGGNGARSVGHIKHRVETLRAGTG